MARSAGRNSAETFTFLFTDLEGSTRLWEKFPDTMKDALKRHDAILRAAIEASGGRVVKSTGDGTLAVFGGAVDAVTASLAAQRDLASASWSETGPLRVRMGLHSGQADQRAADFFGPTVNRAARIMAAGHGGQVLLSAAAASLAIERLPAGASLHDLGEHRLKDLGRAEHIFQLVHPDLASSFPPLATLSPAAINLPTRTAAFVGRQAELTEIRDRLLDASARLLTLIGPGGTGKTTLAIRAAEEGASSFPDGMCFVDLLSAQDSSSALVAIARAIGLGEIIDRPLLEELTNYLRNRHMLLVLDNFEQVTEAAAVVAQLLGDCPKLSILATSREALHVRAEHVFPVSPLTLPPVDAKQTARQVEEYEAVQLFVDRARAARPDFQLTDGNAAAVAEICHRLDGLPLAIELAAARLRLLSPDALRNQLHNRLGLLRGGPRDLPERQQTLRATIDWSYKLLETGEQRLFELLAVFADAELAAVETLADQVDLGEGNDPNVLDRLTGLVDKSLIRQVDPDSGEPRVTMLETIREYAAERLDQRPDLSARARRCHAAYYADLANKLQGDMTGGQRAAALEAMAAEVGNLRIAWDYWVAADDLERLERLVESLLVLNDARGWYLDTVRLTTDMLAVLARSPSLPDRIAQEIALRIGLARALMATKGFTPEVEKAFISAVELFERGTDVGVRQKFSVLRGLFSLYQFSGQLDKAAQLGQDVLAIAERENDPRMLIDGHLTVAAELVFADIQKGLDHLDHAISLFPSVPAHAYSLRGPGNDPRVACLTTAAFGLWLIGRPDRAVERVTEALTLAAELDHPFTSAFAHFHASLIHTLRREFDLAHDRAVSARQIGREYDLQIWNAVGSCLLGVAQTGLGRPGEGMTNLQAGMDLYRGLRSPPVFWPILLLLAATACHRAGRPADGLRQIEAATEIIGVVGAGALFPEFQIVKGDLIAAGANGSVDQAERWYQLAFDGARELNARMSQLRAATRLSRGCYVRGQHEAVVRTLGPVYASFSEGLATVDLTEARDLLTAIAPIPSFPTQ